MRLVYPVCCGVDVHKTFLVATIITTTNNSILPKYQQKRFSTYYSGLLDLAVAANNCKKDVHGEHRQVLGSCLECP